MAKIGGGIAGIGFLDDRYLRLDTSNGPLTGALEISAQVVQQLKISFDVGNYAWFEVNNSGHLTIDSSAKLVIFPNCEVQAAGGIFTGGNVTSGTDPGHLHTGASLSSIDISADTNLAVTAPIILTDDTLSLGTIDISANTNLAVSSPIVLTDDTLSFDFSLSNIWTGATNTFNDVVVDKLITSDATNQITLGTGIGYTILTAPAQMSVKTITMPPDTCTLAGLGLNNTWTGTNTFQSTVTLDNVARPTIHLDSTDSAIEWYIRTGATGDYPGWFIVARSTTGAGDIALSTSGQLYLNNSLILPDKKGLTYASATEWKMYPFNSTYSAMNFGMWYTGTTPNRTSRIVWTSWATGSAVIYMDLDIHETDGVNLTIGGASVSNDYDLGLINSGVLMLKETTTPTADTNYGKIYTKNDNNLYFQDGAGTEHTVAFV